MFPSSFSLLTVPGNLAEKQSASKKPAVYNTTLKDDDMFYVIYPTRDHSHSTLSKLAIKKLEAKYPGIFNEFKNKSDLLTTNPLKYQPLACLMCVTVHRDFHLLFDSVKPELGPSYHATPMTFGQYKAGFYTIDIYSKEGCEIETFDNLYRAIRESELFISKLREVFFDNSINNHDKISMLKNIFSIIKQDDKYISANELIKDMDKLISGDFKPCIMTDSYSPITSAEHTPTLNDDDDFYIIHSLYDPYSKDGELKEETIKKLERDYPDFFKGLENKNDIFGVDPVKYQPLARLLYNAPNRDIGSLVNHKYCCVSMIPYGHYKYDCYEVEGNDDYGACTIEDYDHNIDHYNIIKYTGEFTSKLRNFLFDETKDDDYKAEALKSIMPSLENGDKDITIGELFVNAEFVFSGLFKQVQMLAIRSGLMS